MILVSVLINGDSQSVIQGVLYLVFGNIFFILFTFSYVVVIIRGPTSTLDYGEIIQVVPRLEAQHPKPHLDHYLLIGDIAKKEPLKIPLHPGERARFCGICEKIKPLRTHHCSSCKKCVIKMDHHCPWFGECIGFSNYKAFILSLFWAVILCIWLFGTLLQQLIWELVNDKLHGASVQYLVICSLAFLLWIAANSLLIYHLYLISYNVTTLEHLEMARGERMMNWNCPYSYGTISANYYEIFGDVWWKWFSPMESGVSDPIKQGGMTFAKAK